MPSCLLFVLRSRSLIYWLQVAVTLLGIAIAKILKGVLAWTRAIAIVIFFLIIPGLIVLHFLNHFLTVAVIEFTHKMLGN